MTGTAYKSLGTGAPIIFLHGLGGGAESWNPQLKHFSQTHHAIAIDFPGYGASPGTEENSFEAWSEELHRFINDLGLERVAMVGHSLGGMVAQEFMIKYSQRVDKLVLSCTSPAFGSKDGDFQKTFIAQRLAGLNDGGTMRDVAESNVPQLFSPNADEEKINSAIATMMQVSQAAYRAALDCLVAFDRREYLEQIRVPTLLISAQFDKAAPVKVMERMNTAIPGSAYRYLEGVGHLPNIETPDIYNAAIRGFISDN